MQADTDRVFRTKMSVQKSTSRVETFPAFCSGGYFFLPLTFEIVAHKQVQLTDYCQVSAC